MAKVLIRGCKIRYCDLRYKEQIMLTRIHMTADMSRPLADEMGWLRALYDPNGIPKDGWESMKMEGNRRLSGLKMSVSGLEAHDMEIVADEAKSFEVHRVTDEEHGSTKVEVRFIIVTTAFIALVEAYWRAIGEGLALLTMETTDDQQAELDLGDKPSDEQAVFACADCEADVPLEDGEHKDTETGEIRACQHAHAKADAPRNAPGTIASISEMKRRGKGAEAQVQ